MKKQITLSQLKKLVKEHVTPGDPDYQSKRELGENQLQEASLSLTEAISHLKLAMENLPHGEEYQDVLDRMKRVKFTLDDMFVGGVRESGKNTSEQFTIRYTDNAAAEGGENKYLTTTFTGTRNEVLNFCAYFMNMGMAEEDGSLSKEQYEQALDGGDWEVVSDREAQQAMEDADSTIALPVIFWIKDSKGRDVYVGQWSEEDFKSWDEEGGDVEVED